MAVLTARGARAWARALQRDEGPLVLARDAEGSVLVLLHRPRAVARVRRPNVLVARAVIRHDDQRRKAAVARLGLALPARIRQPRSSEREDAGEQEKWNSDATHLKS